MGVTYPSFIEKTMRLLFASITIALSVLFCWTSVSSGQPKSQSLVKEKNADQLIVSDVLLARNVREPKKRSKKNKEKRKSKQAKKSKNKRKGKGKENEKERKGKDKKKGKGKRRKGHAK